MSKRAMTDKMMWEVGMVAMISLTTIMFLGVYSPIEASVRDVADMQACRLSAAAASDMRTSALVDLECPTQNVVVKADGIYQSSLRTTKQEKTSSYAEATSRLIVRGIASPQEKEILREMALYAVANEMKTCWFMFGEGLYNPFSHGALMSDTHCVVCSSVDFSDNFRNALGVTTIDGFKTYLEQTTFGDGKTTFGTYLRPKVAELERVMPFIFEIKVKESGQGVVVMDTLDLTQPIDIIFQAESPSRLEKFYEELGMQGNARAVFAVSQSNEGVLQCDALF